MHNPFDDSVSEPWSTVEAWPPGNPATILCVDDEPHVLAALARVLRPCGYRLLSAERADAALELLERNDVDVIVADMRMPGTDGIALLETTATRWPRAARILLTGSDDVTSAAKAINRGRIFRYLLKPWDDDEVRLSIQQALDTKALEAERSRLLDLTRRQKADLAVYKEELEERVAERTDALSAALKELEHTYAALDAAYVASVRVFASLAEAGADPDGGHGRRVADWAYRLAVSLDLGPHQTRAVLFAGTLHDIGKLALPAQVRHKPELDLTPEEHAAMRRHPLVGEAMLMGLPPLRDAARLIRHHHERMDGSGYPDGIRGGEIALGARIVSLASDFDALVSGQVHGRPMDRAAAAKVIVTDRDRWYDPHVVGAFLDLIDRDHTVIGSDPSERAVDPRILRPGMVLARDLISDDGIVLLTAGHRLDDELIGQLRRTEEQLGWTLKLAIRADSGDNP